MKYISNIMMALLSIALVGCFADDKGTATPLKFGSTQGNTTIEVGQEFRYDILVTPAGARDYEITVTGLPDWLTLETEKSMPVPAHSYPTTIEYLAAHGEDIYFVSDGSSNRTVNKGRHVYKTRIGSTENPELVFSTGSASLEKYIGGMTIAGGVLYVAVYSQSASGLVTDFYKLNLANENPAPEFIRQVPGKAISIAVRVGRLHWNDGSRVTRSIILYTPKAILEESYVLTQSLGTLGIDAYGNIHMDDSILSALRTYVSSSPAYKSSEIGCITGISGTYGVGTYIASDDCWTNNERKNGKLRFVPIEGQSTEEDRVWYEEGEIVFDKPVLAVTSTASGRVVWSIAERNGANDPSLYTFSVQQNTLVGTPTEAGTYPITLTLPGGAKQTFTITVTEPPVTYAVGGDVNGLLGTVRLSNNGTDILSISNSNDEEGSSSFSFSKELEEGDAYNVAVVASPAGQTCTLRDEQSASGEIGTSDIEVIVDCEFNTYAIGGTVSGLTDTLVLTLNEGEASEQEISVTEDTFSFAGEFDVDFEYNVEIKTQPEGQTCELNNTFRNEAGQLTTPVVSGPVSLSITCEDLPAEERTLSVTVEGLPDGTTIAMTAINGSVFVENETFETGTASFNNTMRDGETFDIRVIDPESYPAGYTCSISGESPLSGDIDGYGTVTGNVTVTVSCVASGGGDGGGELPDPEDPFLP